MSAAATLPRLPLPKDRAQQLSSLIDGLDAASLWWLSGYTAGLASKVPLPAAAEARAAVEPQANARLTILYGSQTGNCKRVAEGLAHDAEHQGVAVRVVRADAYPVRELAAEHLLYVVISTQGDGDPPDDAITFLEFLAGRRAPRLDGLSYAVLGLGDSSYPQFCVTGRRLDARLAELGAKRLLDFGEADLDYETVVEPWAGQALASARELLKAALPASVDNVTPLRPRGETAAWSPAKPFHAELVATQRITSADSAKDVRHLELDLAGSGLEYEPGDSLGVVARNPAPLVAEIIDALHLDGATNVTVKDDTRPLQAWLSDAREITRLSRPFLAALAGRSGDPDLQRVLQPEAADELRRLLDTTQPIDLLGRHAIAWSAEELVTALRPLAPRLYSIASSREEVGEEAHLTVAHVQYQTPGGTRWGAASHWLATRAEGAGLEVYLERNERFRLPEDASRDIIMVGPGTGVAPFRAFLQQRAATGATGRNWLLFGNPHFRDDFLYQLEWQAALKAGTLTRLDLAFSRDQADKVYVQQRLRERGHDVLDWLENGAHLYLCGATAMAREVEAALVEILVSRGGKTQEGAAGYVNALREQHRFAKDVY